MTPEDMKSHSVMSKDVALKYGVRITCTENTVVCLKYHALRATSKTELNV